MKKIEKLRGIALLVPLLFMASCNTNKPPVDYEINKNITNVNGGVYYEIFVRSFADSIGDGHGDLQGIANKIPYLQDLGVKGIWLTPIHPSPSYHGYDVMDYTAINADFGTLNDFDEMIATANEHNIDVIIDLVINHSSSSHPWYLEAKRNKESGTYNANDPYEKANWYDFENAYFGANMPEFLLDNIAVREEIVKMSKFWLDRGVKGFRLDATSHFYKAAGDNIRFLTWFSDMVKTHKPGSYIVAEAWINSFTMQKEYYRGVESLFNFQGADVGGVFIDNITSMRGNSVAHYLDMMYNELYAVNDDALMAMFLTNHDMDRSSQMFLFDFLERQKLAASMYLLTPGVPFMYYGEEIGIKGSRMNAQTDANRRLPMLWQKNQDSERPALPPLTDYPMENQVRDGVKEHLAEPFSLLNHYKKIINIRNHYPWLKNARLNNVTMNNNAIASMKLSARNGNDFIHVIHNVINEEVTLDISRFITEYNVKIAHDIFTTGTRSILKDGTLTLAPYSSVVLERK